MSMTEAHKMIFQEKRTFLLENLRIEDGVNILDILFREKIITPDDLERISERQITTDKIRYLLDLLPRCGNLAFNGFVSALLETKQDHIAIALHANAKGKVQTEKIRRKLVVVGDGATGKTCLLKRISENVFPNEYIPTIFDNYSVGVNIYGATINLDLWDTAGQEEYDRLRPLSYSYPDTDLFLICFSVTNPASLANAQNKWIEEVNYHCRNEMPIVLTATKIDKRDQLSQKDKKSVSKLEGQEAAKTIKAAFYGECSALTNEGVPELLEAMAALAHFKDNSVKKKSCLIL